MLIHSSDEIEKKGLQLAISNQGRHRRKLGLMKPGKKQIVHAKYKTIDKLRSQHIYETMTVGDYDTLE